MAASRTAHAARKGADPRPGGRRRDGRRVPSGAKGRGYQQDTHTPDVVAEVVYRVFGGIADLDPFGSPLQILRAKTIVVPKKLRYARSIRHEGATIIVGDGGAIDWWGNVFLNPEFEDLGPALEKTWSEVHLGRAEQAIVLGPIRTHRRYAPWFWAANACCFMRPIAFEGWKHQFPLPLGLSYYGPYANVFSRYASILGKVLPLTPWTKRIIMPPMSETNTPDLASELQAKKNAAIVDLARANPSLSISDMLTACELELTSDEAVVLLKTPIGHLVDMAPYEVHIIDPEDDETVEQVVADANRKARSNGAKPKRKPPTNKAASPKAAAPKAAAKAKGNGKAKSNGHPGRVSEVPALLGKFLDRKKKGEQIKTSELMEISGVGRAATLGHLASFNKQIKMRGSGRGAYWEVVS